jgi:hypothetical protein
MRHLQYGSLTGATAYQYFPQETEIVSMTNPSPVSNVVVEEFLRIHDDIDRAYIASLIIGVTQQVENYTGIDTTPRVKQSFWSRPMKTVALPGRVTTNVTNVFSVSPEGVERELVQNVDYYKQGIKRIKLTLNYDVEALRVVYEAGYAESTCPNAIQDAIIQEISLQYKNRQDSNQPSRLSVNNLSIEARHLLIGGGYYEYSR